MKIPYAVVALIALGTAANAATQRPLALTSVGAVTNLETDNSADDPGIGGAFGGETYFRNILTSALGDCSKQIDAAFSQWARTHRLVIPKRELGPGRALIHATASAAPGVFELSYRVDGKLDRARFTVWLYTNDGTQKDPLQIKELLTQFGIEMLEDQLQNSLQCKANSR